MAYVKASTRIAAALRTGLQPHLKRAGFKKSGMQWRLEHEPATQLVQVQMSRGNQGAEGRFVLNLGVYLPTIEKLLHHRPIARPREVECTARRRVGPAARGSDPWWEVDAATDPGALGSSVLERFKKVAEPWLARAADPAELDDALQRSRTGFAFLQDPLAPVALALSVGRIDRAAERFIRLFEEIAKERKKRAKRFPDDPYAIDLIEDGQRLATEHRLAWPSGFVMPESML